MTARTPPHQQNLPDTEEPSDEASAPQGVPATEVAAPAKQTETQALKALSEQMGITLAEARKYVRMAKNFSLKED